MKSVLPPLSFQKDKGGKTLFTGYFSYSLMGLWVKGGKSFFTGYFSYSLMGTAKIQRMSLRKREDLCQ